MWKTLRRVADSISMKLLKIGAFDRLVGFLSYQRKRALRRKVEARLLASGQYGNVVLDGPFRGMTYPPPKTWISARFEKIIGAYEQELHALIQELVERKKNYSTIINVGAADGFYSVGLARLFPDAGGIAYELNPNSRDVMALVSEINSVSGRIRIERQADPETLAALDPGPRPLLVCDVDGYEDELIAPSKIPWLAKADILLELHDIFVPGLSDTIRKRFEGTHTIRQFTMEGHRYAEYPVLRQLNFVEIHAMLGSDRHGLQDWFFMEPLEG